MVDLTLKLLFLEILLYNFQFHQMSHFKVNRYLTLFLQDFTLHELFTICPALVLIRKFTILK
jgi:hypothetical protein